MDAHRFFQEFNPCKCVVYCCLAVFTALIALKRDGVLQWSYWAVFSPIWLWKGMVLCGASVGIGVWFNNPQYRMDGEGYVHFKAMLISLSVHLLLLMFEVLLCDQLTAAAASDNSGAPLRHMWTLVFVPLAFVSIVGIVVCVWACKHDRSCELELVCAVNMVQFIFIPLKLDGLVSWSWEVVLVPLWIVMCVSVVGLLYTLIFAGILLRTANVSVEQRRTSAHTALGYGFLVLPFLGFLVLLSNKLDGWSDLSWLVTVSPLFIDYFTLILLSFSSKPNNFWWFGLRRDFCSLMMDGCPCLREYCNVSYRSTSVDGGDTCTAADGNTAEGDIPSSPHAVESGVAAIQLKKKERHLAPAVANIDLPD